MALKTDNSLHKPVKDTHLLTADSADLVCSPRFSCYTHIRRAINTSTVACYDTPKQGNKNPFQSSSVLTVVTELDEALGKMVYCAAQRSSIQQVPICTLRPLQSYSTHT